MTSSIRARKSVQQAWPAMASYHCTLNKRYTEQLTLLTAKSTGTFSTGMLNNCSWQLGVQTEAGLLWSSLNRSCSRTHDFENIRLHNCHDLMWVLMSMLQHHFPHLHCALHFVTGHLRQHKLQLRTYSTYQCHMQHCVCLPTWAANLPKSHTKLSNCRSQAQEEGGCKVIDTMEEDKTNLTGRWSSCVYCHCLSVLLQSQQKTWSARSPDVHFKDAYIRQWVLCMPTSGAGNQTQTLCSLLSPEPLAAHRSGLNVSCSSTVVKLVLT